MGKTSRDAQTALEHGSAVLRKLPSESIEAVKELASGVGDQALELVESAGDRVSDLRAKIADAIGNHPFRAAGIAIGVGCVIGLIIARR